MPAVIAPFYTPEDITRAGVLPSEDGETPVLRLLAQATARGYESVCLPLTTDAWRTRWHDMCVLSSSSVPGVGTGTGGAADADRGGTEERDRERERVTDAETMTDADAEIDADAPTDAGAGTNLGQDSHARDRANATRAEVWRSAPAFAREEVTVTRLGMFSLSR
jgi:type II protein arginine methyltransferase